MKNIKKIRFKALLILSSFFILISCISESRRNDNSNEIVTNKIEDTISTNKIGESLLIDFNLGKEISCKNLQVWIISGNTKSNTKYLTLKEALKTKSVFISETSNVSELEISNLSNDVIFIQAGDIVKGGKQDRTLSFDMIIGPKSKNVKLSSFCVESGRWSKRGSEEHTNFSANSNMISSKELKIASRRNKSQQEIWSKISAQQSKLNDNLSKYYNKNIDVQSTVSSSSLELTLSNEKLIELKKQFKTKFENILTDSSIGIIYAINGNLNSIDLYNNKKLFSDYFDKLLDAAIVEAISKLRMEEEKYELLSQDELNNLLLNEELLNEKIEKLNERTKWKTFEDSVKLVFTSIDIKTNEKWIHKNIIYKD